LANTKQCANCRKEIVNTNKKQLEVHAETHNQKLWPKEKCWPNDFPTASAAKEESKEPEEEAEIIEGSSK
jgi:hypothetical protein